jgi:hypothetical protein
MLSDEIKKKIYIYIENSIEIIFWVNLGYPVNFQKGKWDL